MVQVLNLQDDRVQGLKIKELGPVVWDLEVRIWDFKIKGLGVKI